MRNKYLKKKENLTKLQNEQNNVKRINVNKYQNNRNYYKNHLNTKIFINKESKTTKDRSHVKSNELSNILGKINQEVYKNKNNYSNISDCFHRNYLNLKGNNTSKTNVSSSKNISRNYSQCSFINRPESYMNDKNKKISIFINNNFSNRNLLCSSQLKSRTNSPFTDNLVKPVHQIQLVNKRLYNKNKISNFILSRSNKRLQINTEIEDGKDIDNDNNKIIQVKILHKSLKKNKSQNKFKANITPIYNNKGEKNNKKNEMLSNPKVIHNMGNFYNFWKDNDGHMGGKINLSLNNTYRNKINFHYYLYYIIKIQSNWRGYSLRKSLLQKTSKSKLNIFYKQKKFLKLLFNIINKKFKKNCFQLFKQKINYIKRINITKGYDIKSSFLNNISNCYQKYNKERNNQNLLLYNKKKLNEAKYNLKLYNKNNNLEINTPKITRRNSNSRYNKDINNKINYTNYKSYKDLKMNELCNKSYKRRNENNNEKEEEKIKMLNNKNSYKKFIFILPGENNHFSINNNINFNNKDNKNKYSARNNIKNKRENSLTNLNKNDNNNNINKYREYIYFLFLLFAKIQKASHRFIFKELINRLNEKKNDNLKKIKNNKLLKIIKNIERKKMLYYFKIFKEKVLTEKIKDIILNKNKKSNLFNIKKIGNKGLLSYSERKLKYNKIYNSTNINNSNLHRQHSSKKHIRIKKMNRSISVNQSSKKNNSNISNIYNNPSQLALCKSSLVSPRKMIIIQRKNYTKPKKIGESHQLTHAYLLRKKVKEIFDKLDKKEIKLHFKRWRIIKDARKKKKFLIYFVMLIKEYFCNDKSLRYNKEYNLGKFMFFWYRKTFY